MKIDNLIVMQLLYRLLQIGSYALFIIAFYSLFFYASTTSEIILMIMSIVIALDMIPGWHRILAYNYKEIKDFYRIRGN